MKSDNKKNQHIKHLVTTIIYYYNIKLLLYRFIFDYLNVLIRIFKVHLFMPFRVTMNKNI